MSDIRNYVKLTYAANSIVSFFSLSDDFRSYYSTIGENEKKSLIRHFIINNVPYAFRNKPILYEQLTQYLADKLGISPTEIKLIGSAKTGFSLSPPPNYGKEFGEHSDLDFSITNKDLFVELENEFSNWSELYNKKEIQPYNENEKRYWSENVQTGLGQLKHGFIDTHYIPNRDQFTLTKKINNSLWLIKKYLEDIHQIKIRKASASVYIGWQSFSGRLHRNTEYVMRKVQG
jgi:hypothetical protein